jgi:hypothetical protein
MLVEVVKVWLGLHVDPVLSHGSAASFRFKIPYSYISLQLPPSAVNKYSPHCNMEGECGNVEDVFTNDEDIFDEYELISLSEDSESGSVLSGDDDMMTKTMMMMNGRNAEKGCALLWWPIALLRKGMKKMRRRTKRRRNRRLADMLLQEGASMMVCFE